MQAPTTNAITQGEHGQYRAVDYASAPDMDYYAPEDGVIEAIAKNNGDCGYSFNLRGATGVHGFCHNEELYVSNGQRVVRGQRIAKMGYTGKTVPSGPAGRHLHWVLNHNGAWVYPPSLVNEPFKKEDGNMAMNSGDVENLYLSGWQRKATADEHKAWDGKEMEDWFYNGGGKRQYEALWQDIKNRDETIKQLQKGGQVLQPGNYVVEE